MTAPAVRLAYIVPTIGRPTLAATLASLGAPSIQVEGTRPGDDYGNAPRNRGLLLARAWGCTHVAYCDDDDVATPGAADAILRAIADDPGALHVFRMKWQDGGVVWTDPALRLGNVGSPMLVHPADVAARWGTVYQSDIAIAVALARELGRVAWHEDVVCRVRPHERTGE